ncbi:MAG: hypothetical protein OXF98_01980 [Rhodospirillaceae bacterium]|nr:hypothetical protein [Rhodospirillaceae bacterium]
MHNAKLDSSPRLQRVLTVLEDATGELSTRDICFAANVHALSSIISELRAPPNNRIITCRQVVDNGERRWLYRLVRPLEQMEMAL